MSYEEERAARALRRKRRRRRQRITSIVVILVILAILAAVIYAVFFREGGISNVTGKITSAGEAIAGEAGEKLGELKDKISDNGSSSQEEAPVPAETEAPAEPVTEAAAEQADTAQARALIEEADKLAVMYDYDGAAALVKGSPLYSASTDLQAAAAKYEEAKNACVAIPPEEVTHIFYHSLVVDPERAFDPDLPGYDGWQQWMVTVDEFNKVTQEMYDRGYVLVSIHDLVKKTTDDQGNVKLEPQNIYLPEGKKPFVMSQDDLCYYHTYDDRGVAARLILDENGKVVNEYIQADGTLVTGDYDVVPLMDRFLEAHPDGCYKGARGIIALTGYNGVLGYRTDGTYSEEHNENTEVYYMDDTQREWLDKHPDYDFETEVAAAKKVADAMKANGWEFASHTWGHKDIAASSYDEIVRDTKRWKRYIVPVVGEVDTIIFAHGTDISTSAYTQDDSKYTFLKSEGFDIFCPVDSTVYQITITEDYMHQGRRNIDGYRIYNDMQSSDPMTGDLFVASEVIDPDRPLPVPDL